MSCLSVVCLYVAGSLSASSSHIQTFERPVEDLHFVYQAERGSSYGVLGNVAVGIESKGFFIELDHTSSIENSKDSGWEEVKIGYRKSFDLIK